MGRSTSNTPAEATTFLPDPELDPGYYLAARYSSSASPDPKTVRR
jgi:hypothetical protein